jgi:hypothetical protein
VVTTWDAPDIWLRREVDVADAALEEPYLRVYHDEDATIYLNGQRAADVSGFTTDYVLIPLPPAAAKALRAGKNTIAVHCRQTIGGQGIDVGIVDARSK